VYSGSSPGIVIDTVYTLKYVKIKFFNSDGTTSNFSAEQSVTPGNIGALSLISNPVKIATDGSIFTGDLDAQGQAIQSGARIFFNRVGLFVYDSTTAGPTTQIVGDASTSSPTFITTSAKIADWMITSNKIENTLHAGTSSYAGLSPSGTYAFWAGSTVSGGNAQANFSVTPAGAVIAKNITITGGSLTVGASSIAASTGKLISTDAEITGKITANSGTINGNLDITGTFYIGSSPSSGDRILINSGGIAAYANGIESPRFQLAKDGTGKIGGWTINSTTLSSIGGAITLNPADGIVGPAVSGGYAFKLDSDGDFSFAGGKISYNHSTSILIIQNTKLQLNIENNEDGTSGDKTVVVDEETGFLTTGRAFFFGGGSDPRTAGPGGSQIQSRAQYNNGSQGDSDFDAGDIWMQRE